jgi:acyl dehydratase
MLDDDDMTRRGEPGRAPRTITGLEGLRAAAGSELGVTGWVEITQELIDGFAEATGDRYWAHIDPARAAASSLGSTIAHGLLTLSLEPSFRYGLVDFAGFSVGLNSGYDRVRFPAPLPVGSRLRMRCELREVAERETGVRVTLHQTFEREGGDRPVCVADAILTFIP